MVHGGQQPVSGAAVQLYAVGTAGDGSAATALLSPAVTTDANGGFTLTGKYTCPSASALVYLVATGGNPGLGGTTNNADLGMMAALGQCGTLGPSTFIVVDELTTVAAVYPLAPFMTSATAVGSAASDATGLATAFTVAAELVNTSTGMSPGTNVPGGTSVPVAQINTIGDILAGCVNSAGGVLGDSSACGQLLALTAISGATTTPTDTITALLSLANNPGLNTAALYNLAAPVGPFEPAQPQTPPDLAVRMTQAGGLTVSPAMLSFPAMRLLSTSAAQSVTFTNNTANPVGIDLPAAGNADLSGANAGSFRIVSGTSYTCVTPIPAGGTCTVSLTFEPGVTGSESAYLTVTNTSSNPVIGIPLTGQGLETSAGPAYLSSGSMNLTTAGTPTMVTLTNSGSAVLTIDGISISNDPTSGQPAFTETENCGTSLAGKTSCTINVSALSTTQLYSTGVLTVGSDAQNGPLTLSLSYSNGFTGPISVNFGGLSEGRSILGDLNGIGGPLNQTLNFTVSGPDAADFTVDTSSTSCTIERLYPTCGVALHFAPLALGPRTASLTINGVPRYGLIGVGLPAGIQFDVVSASIPFFDNPPALNSVSFSPVNVGTTSAATTVTVMNTGTAAMTLNAPALSGANASDFNVTGQCPASIAPGGTCNLTITATPSQPAYRVATLTLQDSTGAAQQALTLSVLGLNGAPVASPNTLNFYSTPVGTVSASQMVTVAGTNNDPVMVTIEDGEYLPFVLTGAKTCAQTPCQIAVAYAPTLAVGSSGTSYANVLVVDLYSGMAGVVSLSGTTQPPPPVYSLDVSPTGLTFAAQTVGTTSAAQTLTVSNTGNQALTLSVDGSGNTDYVVANNNCGPMLAVGANCTVNVSFQPTATGTRPGSVTFTSNGYFFGSVSSPYSVPFTGPGQ